MVVAHAFTLDKYIKLILHWIAKKSRLRSSLSFINQYNPSSDCLCNIGYTGAKEIGTRQKKNCRRKKKHKQNGKMLLRHATSIAAHQCRKDTEKHLFGVFNFIILWLYVIVHAYFLRYLFLSHSCLKSSNT